MTESNIYADVRCVVLIATSGRPNSCRDTLTSLSDAALPANLDKVMVVENGPAMGVDKIVEDLKNVLPLEYLYVPEANKSGALNAGLGKLQGNPLIIFFDDDVIVGSQTLLAYSDAAAKLPRRAYLGGPALILYEKQPRNWLKPRLPPSVRGLVYEDEFGLTEPNIFFLGFNWACYRSLLEEAGQFDRRFGPGGISGATGQETAMQDELNQLGVFGYYVPQAHVYHRVGKDSVSPRWLLKRWYRNGIRHGFNYSWIKLIFRIILPWNLPFQILKIAFFAIFSRVRAYFELLKVVMLAGIVRGKLLSYKLKREY